MSSWHPDDMTLTNYVAGNISAAEALAIAMHLSFCHECRAHVKNLNQLGGALLESIKTASIDDRDFDALMASLDAEISPRTADKARQKINKQKIKQYSTNQKFTNPLQRYLPTSLNNLPWKRQTKTISSYDLTALINEKGFQVVLQKVSAGAKIPTHTHKGCEYTVVLNGGFSDELGVYHQGDFIARDTEHHHSPTALQNEDCICLTVLSAPIKFTGWYRVLNPFMVWN